MVSYLPYLLALSLASAAPPEPRATFTLEQSLEVARSRHPRLRSAASVVEASAAQQDVTFSPFLPQLGFTLGYQRTTGNVAPRPGQTFGAVPEPTFDGFNYYSASLTMNQLIWDFGQTLHRWEAAQSTLGAARASLRAVRLEVELGVRVAYVNALAAKALVVVAEENLASEQRHLKQVQAFVAAEARPAVELAKSRALVAAAEAQLIAARGGYDGALSQLRLAMGVSALPGGDPADLPEKPAGDDGDLDALLAKAVKARPELQALALQEEAQRLITDAARGAYWPTFGLTLAVTDAGTELTKLGWNMSAGIGLTWNFYQGGLTAAQVRQAEAVLEGLAANVEAAVHGIRAEIAQILIDLRTARGQLAASEEALAQAREQVRLAEGRYAARVGSVIELADAETARANAATNVVVVRFRMALARVRLIRALGEGVP